jgi:hypothetical protein
MSKIMSFQELAAVLGALCSVGGVACSHAVEPARAPASPIVAAEEVPAAAAVTEPSLASRTESPASAPARVEGVESETAAATPAEPPRARHEPPTLAPSLEPLAVEIASPTVAPSTTAERPKPSPQGTQRKRRKAGAQGGCGAGTCA